MLQLICLDVKNVQEWISMTWKLGQPFEDDSFVVMETGTLSFSTDIKKSFDSNQENIWRRISFSWKYSWFFVGKFHS